MGKTILKIGEVVVGVTTLIGLGLMADRYSHKLKHRERDTRITDALDNEDIKRALRQQKEWLDNGWIDSEEYHRECNQIVGKAVRKYKNMH